jgi:hypothetical protein
LFFDPLGSRDLPSAPTLQTSTKKATAPAGGPQGVKSVKGSTVGAADSSYVKAGYNSSSEDEEDMPDQLQGQASSAGRISEEKDVEADTRALPPCIKARFSRNLCSGPYTKSRAVISSFHGIYVYLHVAVCISCKGLEGALNVSCSTCSPSVLDPVDPENIGSTFLVNCQNQSSCWFS